MGAVFADAVETIFGSRFRKSPADVKVWCHTITRSMWYPRAKYVKVVCLVVVHAVACAFLCVRVRIYMCVFVCVFVRVCVQYLRQIMVMPDGGSVALDWEHTPEPDQVSTYTHTYPHTDTHTHTHTHNRAQQSACTTSRHMCALVGVLCDMCS